VTYKLEFVRATKQFDRYEAPKGSAVIATIYLPKQENPPKAIEIEIKEPVLAAAAE